MKVKKIIPHPKYNEHTLDNDIALLKVEKIQHYKKVIKPICIPDSSQEFAQGTRCYIAGWGDTYEDGVGSKKLKVAKVSDMIDRQDFSLILYLCISRPFHFLLLSYPLYCEFDKFLRYRKISNISPGLIKILKHFLGGLYSGGLYSGGLYSEGILC